MKTAKFRAKLPVNEFKSQQFNMFDEIYFHNWTSGSRISLENLLFLVQSTKINFMNCRGTHDV